MYKIVSDCTVSAKLKWANVEKEIKEINLWI